MNIKSLIDRPADGHKGTFGKIGIIAGSRDMPGAAALASTACLKSGAGTATVLCPKSAAPIISSVNPCVMTVGLPEDDKGRLHLSAKKELLRYLPMFDVIAVGPGWGRSMALESLLKQVLAQFQGPIVIDADGLNCLSGLIRTGQFLPSEPFCEPGPEDRSGNSNSSPQSNQPKPGSWRTNIETKGSPTLEKHLFLTLTQASSLVCWIVGIDRLSHHRRNCRPP